MMFVMRAEPTHIIISAQQMWNRSGGLETDPSQPWISAEEAEVKEEKAAFPKLFPV